MEKEIFLYQDNKDRIKYLINKKKRYIFKSILKINNNPVFN